MLKILTTIFSGCNMGGTRGSNLATGADVKRARSDIEADKTITDQTKQELLGNINVGLGKFRGEILKSDLAAVGSTFSEAREGRSAKFKSRQFRKAQLELAQDRPGRRQIIAPTSGSSTISKTRTASSSLITGS